MIEVEKTSLSSYYFEEDAANQIYPSINNDYVDNYPSIIDRFFVRYFYLDPKNPEEAYTVLFHSNRVCMIGLASMHPAISKGIKNISFLVGSTNRNINGLKGKGKKGGVPLQKDTILAILTTNDDVQYKIPSCIKSKLLELNTDLLENPGLCSRDGYGFIAIVLPKIENCDEIKNGLLTQEEFEKHLKSQK